LGLVSAIEWQIDEFERRTSIRCELRVEPREIETGTEISTAVYRILQEALTNITRHSGARKAEVELQVRDTTLKLTIQDDGTGLDPRRLAEGKSLGLKGMEERARLLAGRFDVRSLATGGTQIVVEIPIRTER
jgi:signal transduction histidine kinase